TAQAAVDSFTFTPTADTYVDSSKPTTSFGTAKGMWVGANPVRKTFLSFSLANVGGRTPVGAHLQLYGLDPSAHGGDVYSISLTSWTESITYNTAPAIDGPLLGSFGSVTSSTWIQVALD